MTILQNFSPNYSKTTRSSKSIKYVIIHYTGMQSEIASIKRLKNPKYKVSCHYLINRKGLIVQMVEDRYVAWHAGKSKWKKTINLNKNSIGIELVNKGHKFGYQRFSNAQITSLIKLCKNLKRKYSIKKENFLGHSDISPLRKVDPGEKFPWKKLSDHNLGVWFKMSRKKISLEKNNIETLFFKNLQKFGYRYFNVMKKSYKDKLIVKSFQQHFSPNDVTGEIDTKTFEISHFLTH